MIRSLLIANRGEIAVRIMRTCRRLGIRTIAVYSDADRNALHVKTADSAYRIGPGPARDSYLRAEAVIEAAQRSGADAVHPGYGFLSEKPELAAMCNDAGLVFVGPSADRIASMGQKIGAKRIADAAGVPCVPGYAGDDQADERLRDEAKRIGFPVMIKASAGGGGRGMRRVFAEAELASSLDLARREADAAFGDSALLIEKLVQRPRHLEVQIAGDRHGNLVHLFERDCSVQRNNQKLLEEAPAPNLTSDVRAKLLERGVVLGKAIAYDNLGTVEFILEEGSDEPWFLEMNTRLQVEHPVTEMITGFDLVEWQIRIAGGEPLPAGQNDIREQGHAIEARITAERADRAFQPEVGRVTAYRAPPDIRVDSGIAAGSDVTPFYDSLLAKAIASGATRTEALTRLAAGLRGFVIGGPATTIPFLIDAIEQPAFREGRATTRFLDDVFPQGWTQMAKDAPILRAGAALLFLHEGRRRPAPGAWAALAGFRLLAPAGGRAESRVVVTDPEGIHALTLTALGDCSFQAQGDGPALTLSLTRNGDTLAVETESRIINAVLSHDGPSVVLHVDGTSHAFTVELASDVRSESGTAEGSGLISAPMPGSVAELKVAVGDIVAIGQVIVIFESMKLFNSLAADLEGRVAEITCKPGDIVGAGARLVRIEAC